ncbi:DUF397 domain-containing protein [Streptomyces sp. NPDC002394]
MIRKASAGDVSELAWFKSSYSSGPEGDSCIEVAWRKSSYSSSSEGDSCVEVGATSATVHVRDSKNIGGPQLALTPGAWAGFVSYAVVGG